MKKFSFLLSFAFALCLSVGANAQCAKSCSKTCKKSEKTLVKADASKADDTKVASMSLIKDVENVSNPDFDGMTLEECAKKHGITVEECAKLCAKQCSKNKEAGLANSKKAMLKDNVRPQPVRTAKKMAVKKAAASMQ